MSTVTVAIDASPLLGPITGIGAAVREMSAALDRRDDVVLRPYALSMRGQLRPGMVRLPLPAAVAQRFWAHADRPRLDRRLRPAQVLHATNYVVGPSRLPRLVSVYDCWFLRNIADSSPDVRRAGEVLRRAVAGGATVHASSHATADAVRELLSTDRVEVIHLAALPTPIVADTQDTAAGDGRIGALDGAPFVLAIGTMEKRKNLPTLIEAFGRIGERLDDLRLVLAGADGDDRPAIERALDALSTRLRERVLLTGRVDPARKEWLLTNAAVLAYPSLDEGFGFPLLEAMQHHLPVVASTRGSIPEVAGDAALLVDPLDADALAAGLETALTDSDLSETLIERGLVRVSAFSWADTAARLSCLYHRLAEERAS